MTDDDTGQVVSGALMLRGQLVRVLLEKPTERWEDIHSVPAWWVKGVEKVQGDSLECDSPEGRSAIVFFDTEEDVSECVLFLSDLSGNLCKQTG